MGKLLKKKAVIASLILCLCAAIAAALVYNGIILLNNPSREEYPVRGIDVSSWQGQIDWQVLAAQELDFAFIKATEGSGFVDSYFADNWEQAHGTDLLVGAYHFFSYDSAGDTQADNFISTVPALPDALPPVVDIEFYGDKEKNPPDRSEVALNLQTLLNRMEAHYGKKPIIYATMKSYRLYIEGAYEEYPIWIRDVISRPKLPDGREYLIWQYTNRGRLDGYQGDEPFIDINVFCGTREELESMCVAA